VIEQNNTDHINDLDTYLNCGRNINKAAKALVIHKNSMYYRISRVEEILGADLQDESVCFSLQLTLKYYKYS